MATHDYNLANQDGASFRSDLNNALSAIVSNNSSSTAPATTFAHQIWVDTTANVIKQRNAANDAWVELWRIDGGFNAKTFSSNITLNAQSDLRFADSDSSNWVAFQAPATVSSNVTWTLPSADGTADQALTTNGSGVLSWADAGGVQDNITEGNTSAEVVDTGSDGHFKVVTEGTEAIRIDSSRRLLVGTNAAYTGYGASNANKIQVAGNFYSNAAVSAFVFGNTTAGGYLNLGLSRNTTIDSHTAVQDTNQLGGITFNGSDGSTFKAGASIDAYVDGTPGTNNMPCQLIFGTNGGSSSPTERMRITKDGYTRFGDASYYHTIRGGGGNNSLEITANAGQQNAGSVSLIRFYISAYGAAITERVRIAEYGTVFTRADSTGCQIATAASAGTSVPLCQMGHSSTGITGGTISFKIWSNGDVLNSNNSYGSLSDIKLKENIVDANSQWDDLKAVQVRNYNFKEETGNPTHTQIGVIAQELELVSPGLVYESPDRETVEIPALDENGDPVLDENGDPTFTTEERETGEVTKSVNYSVLYMKAVKALQEAMERIESLEARLTALEGGA